MKCTFGRPSNEPNTESITTEWQTREHDNNQHAKTTTYGLSFITIYPVSSSIHHDHGFTLYVPLKVNRKSVWIEWILFPQFSAYATRVWLHTGKFTAYIHPGIIPSLDGLKPSASVDGVVLLSVFWEKPAAPFKCRIWKQETGLTKWLTLECSLFLTLMLSPFLYPCASSILAYDTMTRFPRASAPPRHIDWWERPRLFDRLQKVPSETGTETLDWHHQFPTPWTRQSSKKRSLPDVFCVCVQLVLSSSVCTDLFTDKILITSHSPFWISAVQ